MDLEQELAPGYYRTDHNHVLQIFDRVKESRVFGKGLVARWDCDVSQEILVYASDIQALGLRKISEQEANEIKTNRRH